MSRTTVFSLALVLAGAASARADLISRTILVVDTATAPGLLVIAVDPAR
jgi:hypothetical protein